MAVENVQRAVGVALFEHRQAAFPRQELPLHIDAQALEHDHRGFIVQPAHRAVVVIHVRRPRFGDDAQFLAVSGQAQASKKSRSQQLQKGGHGLRLRCS